MATLATEHLGQGRWRSAPGKRRAGKASCPQYCVPAQRRRPERERGCGRRLRAQTPRWEEEAQRAFAAAAAAAPSLLPKLRLLLAPAPALVPPPMSTSAHMPAPHARHGHHRRTGCSTCRRHVPPQQTRCTTPVGRRNMPQRACPAQSEGGDRTHARVHSHRRGSSSPSAAHHRRAAPQKLRRARGCTNVRAHRQ